MPLFPRYFDSSSIHEYTYKPGVYTPLDTWMSLNVWEPLVHYVPQWMAPNILTLVGFICTVGAFLCVAVPSPTLDMPIPRTCLLLVALFVFLYQTLDALDGKQARRMKCSSPLGTLFDHGCDIVTVTLLSVAGLGICQQGLTGRSFMAVAVNTHLLQFLFLWYEFYFNVFMSNPGFTVTGVTEAQFSIILCALLAAFTRTDVFSLRLTSWTPWGHVITLGNMIMDVVILNNIVSVVVYVCRVLFKVERSKKLLATLQCSTFIGFVWVEWRFFKTTLIDRHCTPMLVYLLITVVYSTVLIRLLLASVAKRNFSVIQRPILPFVLLTLLISKLDFSDLMVDILILLDLGFQTLFFADFLVTAINDLCTELKISCFRISPLRTE
ncbi:MAG: uncharacterized protein KVP18_000854 [Porospora cf. gigantea A]|uniref:uncharacterized protein n=1 Tax=Porospora cf. gigantea A TaxID=2853593 RepID=UPI00355A5B01|nr:MAG: hypothetical protein KVP18_000854 [Porospora cf. gigantea A]